MSNKLASYCGAYAAYVLIELPESRVTFARREFSGVREIEARVRLGELMRTRVTAHWVLDMHVLEAGDIGRQDAREAVEALKDS